MTSTDFAPRDVLWPLLLAVAAVGFTDEEPHALTAVGHASSSERPPLTG